MFLGKLLNLSVPARMEKHPWDNDNKDVFINDLRIAEKWLKTFSEFPLLSQKKVLEIGCGFGALCVKASEQGAAYVLGVEIDKAMTDICRDVVYNEYPEMTSIIEFTEFKIMAATDNKETYDIILSQNAFEHYDDPAQMLDMMLSLLKPGGRLYAGFGPLWNSPFGSHLGFVCKIPWMHLWNGEWLIEKHNSMRPHNIKSSWKDLFLNQKSLAFFEEIFCHRDDAEVIDFCYNTSIKKRAPFVYSIVEVVRSLSFLREYLTASLFIVIKKNSSAR